MTAYSKDVPVVESRRVCCAATAQRIRDELAPFADVLQHSGDQHYLDGYEAAQRGDRDRYDALIASGIWRPATDAQHAVTATTYQRGYGQGRSDAAALVEKYADDTHPPHSRFTGCQRCDITAALRVAAKLIRDEGQ